MTRIALASLLWAWLILFLYKSLLLSRHRSVGLPLAYVLTTTLVHGGGLVYLVPTYNHDLNNYLASWDYGSETVATGLETSVVGILGVACGVLLANRRMVGNMAALAIQPSVLARKSRFLIAIGASGAFLSAFLGGAMAILPGLAALMGGLNSLLLLGICGLALHFVIIEKRRRFVITALSGAIGVILLQMFSAGILGDSVASAIIIISFALVMFQRKSGSLLKKLFVFSICGYLLLVAAVGWLTIREEVRAKVWSGAGLMERVTAFTDAVSNMKAFDASDQRHLELLDVRMNQNVIIGKMVERLTVEPGLSAGGDTILLAIFGWVPRLVWPNKPGRGGSDAVEFYIGREMSDTSSFGTGPIFEFYINFGLMGVLAGMTTYGYLLRWFDIRSASFTKDGDPLKSSYYFAAGTAMITAMNTLFFIVNGIISAVIASSIVVFIWKLRSRHRPAITGSRFPLAHSGQE